MRQLGAERFIGPCVIGSLALGPGEAQQACLAEGEALLAKDAIGRDHFQFRRLAVGAAIARGDRAEARRHAEALACFSRE
ncbi:hypothetical protein SAMN05444722_3277 [Rhodovulum sp. ES.010]|uniref:hypothetical protein n=1 Tax=Rhodovulum sp. ES.010 TaxID=1882821 RepID=UPI000925F147|nr:hypothetical protein [Rhodovulum sp. ES.010]SIO53840.1 hypothetical protein SAMN05444722_3277 [Rhodovulum sp. ES.010]